MTAATPTRRTVSLPVAAQTLRLSYLAARDWLLRGELDGVRRQGRWHVYADSLAAAKRKRF